jgi:thioredoxin-related protein
MKKLLSLIFISLFLVRSFAQVASSGIQFEHSSWQKILQKAKKEKKIIMLDAYASWCGPCKYMAKNIFTIKEVGDYFNSNFINAKIDMENGDGPDLSKKYEVMAYPTFLFIDGDGKLIHRVCGGMGAQDFIQAGKDALTPGLRFADLLSAYKKDQTSESAARNYFVAAEAGCMDVETEAKIYLEQISQEKYLTPDNFYIIQHFINDYTHSSIKYICDNYDRAEKEIGKTKIDEKLFAIYRNAILSSCNPPDEKNFKDVQQHYSAQKNTPLVRLNLFSKMMWAFSMADTLTYFPAAIEYTNNYSGGSADELNSMAWNFYESTSNTDFLKQALEWADKSVQLSADYSSMDTKASLLFKLGRNEEAYRAAEEAIVVGQQSDKNVSSTQELLKSIKEKMDKTK